MEDILTSSFSSSVIMKLDHGDIMSSVCMLGCSWGQGVVHYPIQIGFQMAALLYQQCEAHNCHKRTVFVGTFSDLCRSVVILRYVLFV